MSPIISIGAMILHMLMPPERIAVISLSAESLPKVRTVPVKTEIGTVKVNNHGNRQRKTLTTEKKSTPLFMTRSASLIRLPVIIAKVDVTKATKNGPESSLRIYLLRIFI